MRIRACGIVHRGGKVLLQRKVHETIWALPGGRVEAGETPEEAVVREFREELGWDVRLGRKLRELENTFTHGNEQFCQTELYFEVKCDAPLTVKDGTLVFRWVSPAEVLGIDFRPRDVRNSLFASQARARFVLSRGAGEEGDPTKLGEARESGPRWQMPCFGSPSSSHCVPQWAPSSPAEEAGEDPLRNLILDSARSLCYEKAFSRNPL